MKSFPFAVQWVAGKSTDGEARGHLDNGQSWDEYLFGGLNALNFDGKDRVRFDSSPPKELLALGLSPIWGVEVVEDDRCSPWQIGPANDDGDPEDQGGEGIPLSQIPAAYRGSKGYCINLKPDAKNRLGRFTCRITLKVGEYEAVNQKGEPFLLITWA